MLLFLNTDGSIAGEELYPSINQGSMNANEIQLVAPFPAAVITVAYTLPNGITLGPDFIDPSTTKEVGAGDYTMTKALSIPGYTVDGATLCVYTYKINSVLTAQSGNLKIQFFVHVDGYCVTSPLVVIPINNGVNNLTTPNAPANTYEDIIRYVGDIRRLLEGVDEVVEDAADGAVNEATEQANAAAGSALSASGSAADASGFAVSAAISAENAKKAEEKSVHILENIKTTIAVGDFDFLFTNLIDLVTNIDNIYGNVLVKGVTIDRNLTFPNPDVLSYYLTETGKVVFKNCTLKAPYTIDLKGWSCSGLYCSEPVEDDYATVRNGYTVSGCAGFGKIASALRLENSDFNVASSCDSVSNALIGIDKKKEYVLFSGCTKISNVTSYATETVYDDCLGLNNLDGSNTYINCGYVDPFTCSGYIEQNGAVGKIPLFTSDGSFSTYDINADAETLRMLNVGGIL